MFRQSWFVGHLLSITPSYITASPQFERSVPLSKAWRDNAIANLTKKRQCLELSPTAGKRLRASIDWLCQAAMPKKVWDKKLQRHVKFKVNFVTLTIPANHEQNNIHKLASKMLNGFLTYARKEMGLRNYVWKLEFTQRKVIHYHITSDTYLPWRKLRNAWNYQLKRSGCLANYAKSKGHYDANSTDVHATNSIDNMQAYLCKYLLKSSYVSNVPCGRLWGCNSRISALVSYRHYNYLDNDDIYFQGLGDRDVVYRAIRMPEYLGRLGSVISEVFTPPPRGWLNTLKSDMHTTYSNMLAYLRGNNLFDEIINANRLQKVSSTLERQNTSSDIIPCKIQVRNVQGSKQIALCL